MAAGQRELVDHYAQLDLGHDADVAAVKRAFKKLALVWHPDKNGSEPAKVRFAAIREAYEVLSKDDSKALYDLKLRRHLNRPRFAGGGAAGYPSAHQEPQHRFHSRDDGVGATSFYQRYRPGSSYRGARHDGGHGAAAEDGGYGPGPAGYGGPSSTPMGGGRRPQPHMYGSPDHAGNPHFPRPPNTSAASGAGGADLLEPVTHDLPCTLEELYMGFERKLKVTRTVEDETAATRTEAMILTVQGKPGCQDGTTILFPGAGDCFFGAKPQDVILKVREQEHASFQREGDDLVTHIRVPLVSALFGHTAAVRTIDGRRLMVPIARVTPDTCIRIPGEGMPVEDGGHGALRVRFRVQLPAGSRAGGALPSSQAWKAETVVCAQCGADFREDRNGADRCVGHPGTLLGKDQVSVVSRDDKFVVHREYRRWSCCEQRPPAAGCTRLGAHRATRESRSAARSRAAQALLARPAAAGDLVECARLVLECGPGAELAGAAELAAGAGHLFAVLLFLRAGQAPPAAGAGSTQALLQRCVRAEGFEANALGVMRRLPDFVRLLADTPGAARFLFVRACETRSPELGGALLDHELIGPFRCDLTSLAEDAAELLCAAAAANHTACVQALLAGGIGADTRDAHGVTALFHGVCTRSLECVSLLLGSDAFAQAAECLFVAARNGNMELAALLVDAGAELDWVHPEDGRTALHEACQQGLQDLVQLLIVNGARVSIRDRVGQRAVDLAMQRHDVDCERLLHTALLEDALHSMAGLTVVRILAEALSGEGVLPPGASPQEQLGEHRPTITVLEDSLRTLCEFSDGLAMCCVTVDPEVIQSAIDSYRSWRLTAGKLADVRTAAARDAVNQLITAGVMVKADLQERVSALEDRLALAAAQ